MRSAVAEDLLPIQPAPLDRDNVFAQSCRLAFVGSMRGTTRGNDYPLTYDSGVTHPLSQYGHQMRGTTAADGAKIASAGIGSILPAASHLTCSMLVRVNSTGSRRVLIGDNDSAGNNGAFSIEQTAASKWRMLVVNTAPVSIEFTSGLSVTTGWHFVDLVQNSSRLDGYIDGAFVGFQTMTGVRRSGNDMRVGRAGAFPSLGFDGDVAYCYFFDKAFLPGELTVLRTNPTQIFRLPRQRSRVGVAGSNFNVAVAEALSAADAASAALIANAAITEAMSAADATLAAMIAAVSASESVTLTDAPSATKTASGSVSEPVTSTDAPSAAMTAAGSVSESATATDTVTGSVNAVTGDVSESVTLTDAQTVAMTAAGTVAESATLIDTVTGAMTASATLTESVTSTEVVDGAVGAVLASVSESVTLTDAPSALMTASVAIAESITATEVILAAMTASGVIAESITLLDVVGGGLPLTASVVEAASLADLVSAIIAQPIASDPRFIIRRATGRDWIIRGRASNWTVREPN